MAHLRGRERSEYVTRMFARIARRYDLLNTVMSAGRHHAWRRMAVREAVGSAPGPALDVATGTCDLALELSRAGSVSSVVGLDRTLEMLSVGRRKALERGTSSVSLVAGDAHDLPFSDNRFVCATVGFGVRNYADLDRAMREMVRVVAPGGRVVVLEIVKGRGRLGWEKLFPLLFRYVTPWLGMVLARDREAYTYLPESVRAFHSAAELALVMERSGLRGVETRSLAMGAVAIVSGTKGE